MLNFANRYNRSRKTEQTSAYKKRLEGILIYEKQGATYAKDAQELQRKQKALALTQEILRLL